MLLIFHKDSGHVVNIYKGTSISIGNACWTLFWNHNWALDTPLTTQAIEKIPIHLQDAKLEDMWSQQQGLN